MFCSGTRGRFSQEGGYMEVPVWHSGFRIQCCCSYDTGCNGGTGLILGPGTSTSWGRDQKEKKSYLNASYKSINTFQTSKNVNIL